MQWTCVRFKLFILLIILASNNAGNAQKRKKTYLNYDSVFISVENGDTSNLFKARIIAFKNNKLYDFKGEGPFETFTSVEIYSLANDSAFSYNHFNYYNIKRNTDTSIPFRHIQNKTGLPIRGTLVTGNAETGFIENHFSVRSNSVYTINYSNPVNSVRLQLYYENMPFIVQENDIYPDTLVINKDIYFSRKTHYYPLVLPIKRVNKSIVNFNGISFKKYTSLDKFDKKLVSGNIQTLTNHIKNRDFCLLGIY